MTKLYRVELSHAANPDIRPGGYWEEPNSPGGIKFQVLCKTLREAAEACRTFITANHLGGGNWTGGKVFLSGRQVAYVSYNGRVWESLKSMVEITDLDSVPE